MSNHTFDPVGAFQRGRAGALNIQQREQAIDAERLAAPRRNLLGDIGLQQARQTLGAGRAAEQRTATTFGQGQALQQARFRVQMGEAALLLPEDQRQAAFRASAPLAQKVGIDTSRADFTQRFTDEFINQGLTKDRAFIQSLTGGGAPEQFTLKPGERRFEGGRQIAAVPTEAPQVSKELPSELVIGLDPDIARKGQAAFRAAGGGKDGLKAFNEIVDKGGERQRRTVSPQILKSSFPKASEAELVQLQASMDAAKTTEAGLKAAGLVREEQRRTKKQQVFQITAIDLLQSILDSDQIGDVVGSIEGLIDFKPFSDEEAELIANIKEAKNILTADNLKLMTGVLSESDIKILADLAGGALTRTRTEDEFERRVQDLIDRLRDISIVSTDDRAAARSGQQGGAPVAPPTAQTATVGRFQIERVQ